MQGNINKHFQKQPLWILFVVLGSFLLIALSYQLYSAIASYQRIIPLHQHMSHLNKLQAILSDVEKGLAEQLPENKTLTPAGRQIIGNSLQQFIKEEKSFAPSTDSNIGKAMQLLDNRDEPARDTLLKILTILREVYKQESIEHKKLTQSLKDAAQYEIWLGLFLLLLLPLGAFFILFLMRKRIFQPLNQMCDLMQLLANRQYQRISEDQIDPAFRPIVSNYNAMVVRLSELENDHLEYEHKLEQQVEQVARTLIEQQQNLANSERLAALGEMTAKLAHEIRNPLAGIKMACTNLQNDQSLNDDVKSRITLVSNEIDRINQLINDLLQQSQHKPEPLTRINLQHTVQELISLALFLIPSHIKLQSNIAPKLVCNLPETQLRQALLNLIINAKQAMAEQPGTISLEARNENDVLIITVCDQGSGFSESFLKQGIRSFNTNNKKGGTGLGLSMVKRFVRNLDGELDLKNQQPQGACVSLKIPCNSKPQDI